MHPLDNVIWKALTTRQSGFAESCGNARRFVPEVSPLAAFEEPTPEGYESLAGLLDAGEMIGLFLDEPFQPIQGWSFVAGAPLLEMIGGDGSTLQAAPQPEIAELTAADSPEMVALAALTKPGPFGSRTHELGTYVGIRRDGKLVAMAGERLKVPGYTEMSAICTHPEHTGRGYAKMLMIELMRRIASRGETSFLHVREDNVHAVELYQRLGFSVRVRGHYAVLRKDPD
jgi:ribosomal protein S18 acetylase RimI-like enzyme